MRKISGILAIALILAACSIITGLTKPEGRVKAENTGYTLRDSVFYEKKDDEKFTNCYGYILLSTVVPVT